MLARSARLGGANFRKSGISSWSRHAMARSENSTTVSEDGRKTKLSPAVKHASGYQRKLAPMLHLPWAQSYRPWNR